MDLKKYLYDIRGLALYSIIKSKNRMILFVESQIDAGIYGLLLSNYEIITKHIETQKSSSKKRVLFLKEIIGIMEPKNKNIAYLVDLDRDDTKEHNNLFVTDYYSIENYPIVFDTNNEYFANISKKFSSEQKSLLRKTIIYKNSPLSNTFKGLEEIYGQLKDDEKISDTELLKKCQGKFLWKRLVKKPWKSKNSFYMYSKVEFANYRVLQRILNYLKLLFKIVIEKH